MKLTLVVMAGLVPGYLVAAGGGVTDGRDKPGHDGKRTLSFLSYRNVYTFSALSRNSIRFSCSVIWKRKARCGSSKSQCG